MRRLVTLLSVFFLSVGFSHAKMKSSRVSSAHKNLKALALKINQSKTVGDWIDRAPKKLKLFRRTHFSRFLKSEMPKAVYNGSSVLIVFPGTPKKIRVLTTAKRKGKNQYYLDGKNITRKSGESMDQWIFRLYGVKKKKRTKTSFLLSFLIPKAFANAQVLQWTVQSELPLREAKVGFWSALIASEINAGYNWAEKDLFKNKDTALANRYRDAVNYINRSLKSYGLGCEDGAANFFMPTPEGESVTVHANLDMNNPESPVMRIRLEKYGSKTMDVGHFAFPVTGFNNKRDSSNFGTTPQVYTRMGVDGSAPGPFRWDDMDGIGKVYSQMLLTNPNSPRVLPEGAPKFSASSPGANTETYWHNFRMMQEVADLAIAACSNHQFFQQTNMGGHDPSYNGVIKRTGR